MKIRISNDEIYEIKMPEEIGIQDFQAIVTKFNFLLKNFIKFDIGGESQLQKGEIVVEPHVYKPQNKSRWRFLRDNREAFIDILKTHYLGTLAEFEEAVKKYDLKLLKQDMSSGLAIALREMHKVNPKEVGLSAFPTKKIRAKDLRLDNKEKK